MTEKPKRIQRKRTKGWRMPENAVYVGRGTKWGNPYRVGDILDQALVWGLPSWEAAETKNGETRLTPALAVELYEGWFALLNDNAIGRGYIHAALGGKNLACWCPLEDADRNPVPCHADVLLEWANA